MQTPTRARWLGALAFLALAAAAPLRAQEVEVDDEGWLDQCRRSGDWSDDERRERVWQEALRVYPGFSAYARRAAPRRISVFVLEPKV